MSQFKGKQKQAVHAKPFPHMEHMAILKDDDSINYVMEVLHNITQKNERAAAAADSSRHNEKVLVNTIHKNKVVASAVVHATLRTEEAIHAAAAVAEAALSNEEAAHAVATAAKAVLRTEEAIHVAAAAAKAALREGEMGASIQEQTPAAASEVTHIEALEKARENNMVERYLVYHLQDDNRIKRSGVGPSAFWNTINWNPNIL